MLTDAGPLIALFDKGDDGHATCLKILQSLPDQPLVTTWPCLTEAMYILDSVGGYRLQEFLWRMRRKEQLILLDIDRAEADRMDTLMEKYRDVPMDMADASLVAVAENRGVRTLFTLDSDFYIYRLADGSALEVLR